MWATAAILPAVSDWALGARDPVIARAFETWRSKYERAGREVTLIDLYALVAAQRGVEPHELDRSERAVLAHMAFSVIWPGFETVPGSERGFEPVAVVAYDATWPERFEHWRARISAGLGARALAIEHVGSTAVPGLCAKPIVDIQISVVDQEDESAYAPALAGVGLQLSSRDSLHRYLRPFPKRPREVHAHVCSAGSVWEREHLLFRDYLRFHPQAASAYGEAKRQLADRWREDRAAYSEAKSPVILAALRAAEEWAASLGWQVPVGAG